MHQPRLKVSKNITDLSHFVPFNHELMNLLHNFASILILLFSSLGVGHSQERHLPFSSPAEHALEWYEKAQSALDKQQADLYMNTLRQAADADSTFFQPCALLAIHAYLMDSTALAAEWALKAIGRDSFAVLPTESALLALAKNLPSDSPDPGAVAESARQLAAASPDCMEAHLLHGRLQAKAGNVTEALKAFFRVRELDPAYGPGYKYLAQTYLAVESWDKAGAYFEMYIVTTPEVADPHHCIGDFYSQIGWTEHALRHYQWALNLEPDLKGVKEKMDALEE
jgi:tetratricopeptide (TPR) repeat protein